MPSATQQTAAAREVLLSMKDERTAQIARVGAAGWADALEAEAVSFFTSLGFDEAQAAQDVATHAAAGGDRLLLIEALVAEQRVVSRLGLTTAVQTEMERQEAEPGGV
jgi:hypothetical protein